MTRATRTKDGILQSRYLEYRLLKRFKIGDGCPFFERNRELIVVSRLTGSRYALLRAINQRKWTLVPRTIARHPRLHRSRSNGRLSVIKSLKLERVRELEEGVRGGGALARIKSRGIDNAVCTRPLTRLSVMRMTSDGIKFDSLL